jgi:hypothetical protein
MSARAARVKESELITKNVRPDSKMRVALGRALSKLGMKTDDLSFNVYLGGDGSIVLKPRVSVPAAEAWLFRNPAALAAVKRGLEEAARGETESLGSFARYAKED